VVQFSANAATGGALACPGGGVSYTITVNPSPNVATPTNQVVCANTSTNAVTFSGNANVYNWSNNTTYSINRAIPTIGQTARLLVGIHSSKRKGRD
jgi:hypothetical protein